MAKKKSKPAGKKAKSFKPSAGKSLITASPGMAEMAMIQEAFSGFTEEERLGFLSLVQGMLGTDDDAGPLTAGLQKRRPSKVERLIDDARSQDSARQAVVLLREAVELATAMLGKKLAKHRGRLGDTVAGLDLLDAKSELARVLRMTGDRTGALQEAREAFELDPSDPCDVRPALLAAYFDANMHDDASLLLADDCAEPWAAWKFGQLLLQLRLGNRGREADEQLCEAHAANPFVLSLLLGERAPDPAPPGEFATGDDGEAQLFAFEFLPCWKETPGAVSWLREAAHRLELDVLPPDAEPLAPVDPAALADLPLHEHADWIVGTHQSFAPPTSSQDQPQRAWLLFAFSPDERDIDFDVREEQPTADDICQFLGAAMLAAHPPSRPNRWLVHPPGLVRGLKRFATAAGIDVASYDRGEALAAMFDQISDRLRGSTESAKALSAGMIAKLPLDPDEVWEAAIVQLPQRINLAGRSIRPWFALVMTRDGMILWHELLLEFPPPETLANAVRLAMARPMLGPPRRPRQILVRELDDAVALRELADEAGCLCDVVPQLPALDYAQERLTRELLGGESPTAQSNIEGFSSADRERFYAAAADYFRAAPWRHFAPDAVVALTTVEPSPRERYGIVMGQSGLLLGIAIYERLDDLYEAFRADSPDQNAQAANGFSIMFGEEADIPPADLDAIEQFGWPVATPEAYPTALRVRPGMQIDAPSADEMHFLTAALAGVSQLATGSRSEVTIVHRELKLRVWRKENAGEV